MLISVTFILRNTYESTAGDSGKSFGDAETDFTGSGKKSWQTPLGT